MDVQLDETQTTAIKRCLDTRYRIVTVSGPAGSGKTTIAKSIYKAFTEAGYIVALSAPTGRAARRQSEVTGLPASTNHKLLEFPNPGDVDPITGKAPPPGMPKRTKHNPLAANVLLLDEGMMVDAEMYRYLIDALPAGGLLRVFGDRHQLKPINKTLGPPPFVALMNKFPTTELSTIHRQGAGSSIIANGARIIEGKMPQRTEEFAIDVTDSPTNRLLADFARNIDEFCSTDHQIICPMRKPPAGTETINVLLQKFFQRGKDNVSITIPRALKKEAPITFFVGDKVLINKNDYNLGVMNGDIGIVVGISEMGEIEVEFGWGKKIFPIVIETKSGSKIKRYDPRENISLGYAITTHKAQGSEWESIYYVVPQGTTYMANRTNFYTAITRARSYVKVFVTAQSFGASLRRERDE